MAARGIAGNYTALESYYVQVRAPLRLLQRGYVRAHL